MEDNQRNMHGRKRAYIVLAISAAVMAISWTAWAYVDLPYGNFHRIMGFFVIGSPFAVLGSAVAVVSHHFWPDPQPPKPAPRWWSYARWVVIAGALLSTTYKLGYWGG